MPNALTREKQKTNLCSLLCITISGERLTPYQAAVHPFLAPECSFANLLPQQGDKKTGLFLPSIELHKCKLALCRRHEMNF